MQSDLPHVLYMKPKSKASSGPLSNSDLNTTPDDEVIRLQEEANRRSEERRKAMSGENSATTLDELFNT